jgi:hypothetical protein
MSSKLLLNEASIANLPHNNPSIITAAAPTAGIVCRNRGRKIEEKMMYQKGLLMEVLESPRLALD